MARRSVSRSLAGLVVALGALIGSACAPIPTAAPVARSSEPRPAASRGLPSQTATREASRQGASPSPVGLTRGSLAGYWVSDQTGQPVAVSDDGVRIVARYLTPRACTDFGGRPLGTNGTDGAPLIEIAFQGRLSGTELVGESATCIYYGPGGIRPRWSTSALRLALDPVEETLLTNAPTVAGSARGVPWTFRRVGCTPLTADAFGLPVGTVRSGGYSAATGEPGIEFRLPFSPDAAEAVPVQAPGSGAITEDGALAAGSVALRLNSGTTLVLSPAVAAEAHAGGSVAAGAPLGTLRSKASGPPRLRVEARDAGGRRLNPDCALAPGNPEDLAASLPPVPADPPEPPHIAVRPTGETGGIPVCSPIHVGTDVRNQTIVGEATVFPARTPAVWALIQCEGIPNGAHYLWRVTRDGKRLPDGTSTEWKNGPQGKAWVQLPQPGGLAGGNYAWSFIVDDREIERAAFRVE